MFESGTAPRIFATPIGVDFCDTLIAGLEARLAGSSPEAWSRVTIFVNTRRTARHLNERFAAGPARLTPRIRLITDIGSDPALWPLPKATPSLHIRLQLHQAVSRLIELQPDLAPRSAAFDLATSLSELLDELHGEGVEIDRLSSLDVSEHSAHWARSLKLISILSGEGHSGFRGGEALFRDAVTAQIAHWQTAPPSDPILVAGSTGSRGTTRMLMEAVSRLPQGGIILPGFDFEQPATVWGTLLRSASDPERLPEEDHPQYRFAALLAALGLRQNAIQKWAEIPPENSSRNRLASLALRPAPVTDQWLRDGPEIADQISDATALMTLIEAPNPRAEAEAIALRLREAVAAGQRAAVITPDRVLARQISAALTRWNIIPDDSAGLPLHQSAPGRLLIEIAALFGTRPPLAAVLSLLKHPLTASTEGTRGPHLLLTREFETWARRRGIPFPDAESLHEWSTRPSAPEGAGTWASWVIGVLQTCAEAGTAALADRLSAHISIAETLAAGPDGADSGQLWLEAAGTEAYQMIASLKKAAAHGGMVTNGDYFTLFRSVLSSGEVRAAPLTHPLVAIWGTLEARTLMADLCILAGLNEGTWPASPPHDPWMNRALRREAGLLLPERRTGLSAHDFQLALGAREVVLSRSLRDADAETVPSRWLNRLVNLLGGLGEQGETALSAMRHRGTSFVENGLWLSQTSGAPLTPQAAQPRPSPCPPVSTRPRALYVTAIAQLIRDPYAIYARHILNLSRLGALSPAADAALKGTVLHKVMENALETRFDFQGPVGEVAPRFYKLAQNVITKNTPWPATARMWLARFRDIIPELIAIEAGLQACGQPVVIEERGSLQLQSLGFRVSAKPDRIDRHPDGSSTVLDYKSASTPPSEAQVEKFDKQLLIEAAIAEAGGFSALRHTPVQRVGYISLGRPGNSRDETLITEDGTRRSAAVIDDLTALIQAYDTPDQGYTARRAPKFISYAGDYDHLSRYGEWDDSNLPVSIKVGS